MEKSCEKCWKNPCDWNEAFRAQGMDLKTIGSECTGFVPNNLPKAEHGEAERSVYALLAEVAKLIRYNAHSTVGISGAMRPAERGVYVKYEDVIEAIRRNFS
jgi:hypothetical protein